MDDKYYDAILHIKTGEDHDFSSSIHYHRYEPTPYAVLEFLAEQYAMASEDHMVDFGCGKGRSLFYFHHQFRMHATGIEMSDKLYNTAQDNWNQYSKRNPNSKHQIHLEKILAEKYDIKPQENKFYFFNPFSVHIFRKVIHSILKSYEKARREIDIILYYPSLDYIDFLEGQTAFTLKQEWKIPSAYERNPNERIMIYTIK